MSKRIAVLLSALVLAGCNQKETTLPEPESRPAKLLTVAVGDQPLQRRFPAISEAGDKAALTFRVSGELDSIAVQSGQHVSKGELLATLNPDEYTLLNKQAAASYKLANVQFKRSLKLHKSKIISDQDFDQAKANLNSAKASLEQAQANLSYTKLTAPYDGTISYIDADEYQYVNAKQGVMNIQSEQLLKVLFQLPDYLLSQFGNAKDAKVTMTFDAFSDNHYPLTFQEISTQADPKTGGYKVTLIMKRPTNIGILPGMSGNVEVLLTSKSATSIPASAIMDNKGGISVWRVNNKGISEKVSVELNQDNQVLSGLNNGDQIIVAGVNAVKPNMRIREWVKERGL
ncbi:efflux RND transporter periplasmic adaptor subunit [Vibrio profundum]|uniref:efflux RND transporter periplasmic adaptor subunit n=1 Tax=Vibrio profundum TaxID=2910247 RepID=UPI003D09D4C1